MLFLAGIMIFVALTFVLGAISRWLSPSVEVTSIVQIRKPPVFGSLTEPLSQFIPHTKNKRKELEKALIASGCFEHNALSNFLARRNASLLLCLLVSAFTFAVGVFDSIELWGASFVVVACILAYSIPSLYLFTKAKRRVHKIEQNLPDALDLIALSVGGGLTLNRSFEFVTERLNFSHPDVAQEFRMISRQAKTGSIDQAFKCFASRMQLPEVHALCTLMRQNQRLGVKMVDALMEFANRMRNDRKLRAEHIGNTATIKLLVPVVICMAPPVFILLIGPAILDLRDFMTRERGGEQSVIQRSNDNRGSTILEEGSIRRQTIDTFGHNRRRVAA